MSYSLSLGQTTDALVTAPGRYLNRHGLITGATGQGKSVSLMGMVEGLHRLGVPTFVTDVKSDLSGLAAMSDATKPADLLYPWWPEAAHVVPLDVYGMAGEPLRASLGQMGAPLVARAMGLTDAQTGVLEVAYAVAEDSGQPLHTLANLRALVAHCSENRDTIGRQYGLVTPASVAGIGRAILGLERSGGAAFFHAQGFDLGRLTTGSAVHLLHCAQLYQNPRLYGAVMLWLLDALFKTLPEVGDLGLPKLALFIDEAHLLFTDAPPALVQMVENTVRLIRSKGVGVYFVTQAPGDLPDAVSRQCHLRVQHALRAVTPRDRSMIRGAAESLPPGDGFRCVDAIEKLSPGVALVSVMGENGQPTATRITRMSLPRCRLSALSPGERADLMAARHVLVNEPPARDPEPVPVRRPFPVVGCLAGGGVLGFALGGWLIFAGALGAGAALVAVSVFGLHLAKNL